MKTSAREYMAMKLREAREEAGLSQDEAGSLVGKSNRTVSNWEHGIGQPDADVLIGLCVAYKVNISYFFHPDFSNIENREGESE